MYKYFYYYNRKYQLFDNGELIRCEYKDIRLHKYNKKYVKLYRINKAKKLKTYMDRDGYLHITLKTNNHQRTFMLHHLVYIVYVMKIYKIDDNTNYIGYNHQKQIYIQINHVDDNKNNNLYTNLELCILQQNIKEVYRLCIHNSQQKAKYIEIYKDGKLVNTIWKIRNSCKFIKHKYNKNINSGTLSQYARENKSWYGFTFKYIEKCNDYRKNLNLSRVEPSGKQ